MHGSIPNLLRKRFSFSSFRIQDVVIRHPRVVLFLWCLLLFLPGIASGTLYRTESLRAVIGREALQGNWFVPTLHGEPFLTKPPGMYIAIALCSYPFGAVTESSARLPSVLAAILLVLVFFSVIHRFLNLPQSLFAAMLLPVTGSWLDRVPSAEIDMLQVMWVGVALLWFFDLLERKPDSRWLWFGPLSLVGFGFLTKWTAPAFFYLTVGSYLVWTKRLHQIWSWSHLLGILGFLNIVGTWIGIVTYEVGWQPLLNTVIQEATQRITHDTKEGYPWHKALAYPFLVLGSNVPFAILIIGCCFPSIRWAWTETERRLVAFLICWSGPNLLFWTLPSQHVLRYSLPISTAVTALGILVFLAWRRIANHPKRLDRCMYVLLILWLLVKTGFNCIFMEQRTVKSMARETGLQIAKMVPEDQILYLSALKDEGILFYYQRKTQKITWSSFSAGYVLITEREWREQSQNRALDLIAVLHDQQRAKIYLVYCPSLRE